jgi:hypothetical protein
VQSSPCSIGWYSLLAIEQSKCMQHEHGDTCIQMSQQLSLLPTTSWPVGLNHQLPVHDEMASTLALTRASAASSFPQNLAASETNATAKAAAPGELPAEVPAANATEAKSREAPAANETIATPKAPSSAATAAAGFVSIAAAALVALML